MARSGSPHQVGTLQFMVRAFRYRNYRLYFSGQIVSLVGTWLSMVATNWLVYRLASQSPNVDEAVVLGAVGFAGQIPIFLLAPFAGVWIDRFARHRVLMVTQALAMLQSFVLGFLAWHHLVTIPQIVVLNMLLGIINAFAMPARQAFVVEVVEDRKDLSNAIALNSSMVHVARSLGPLAAGYLIAWLGEAACFLIDGISYLFVLVALWMMRIPRITSSGPRVHVAGAFVEGLRYAFGSPPIRTLLLMVAVTSLMTMPQSVLMPIFADKILGGSEQTLGKLLGASGVGAVSGTIYLASRRSVVGLGRVMVVSSFTLGVSLIGFGSSEVLVVSMLFLTVTGCSLVIQMASANTLLQTIVDDDKRGRVMSLFTMCFIGMAPFGSLIAGQVASFLGPQWTIIIAGCVCMLSGVAFGLVLPAMRRLVQPIYIQKGILPPVADGLRSSAEIARIAQE